MTSCKLIRLSEGFDIGAAVMPADAKPTDADAAFYAINFNILGNDGPRGTFFPITRERMECFGSGQMDGIGWEICPDEAFESLDAAKAWIEQKRKEHIGALPAPTPDQTLALLERLSGGDPEKLKKIDELRRKAETNRGGT
jgi:hypothetical protein